MKHTNNIKQGETTMKLRAIILSVSMLMVLGVMSQRAMAVGTAAGTAISNQATVSYTAGTNNRTANSNTVTLYVAHRVVGSYSPSSRTESGVDNRTVYYPVSFVNQGNRADNFNISFNSNTGYTVNMVHDVDGDGVFDTGEPDITSTGAMAADATKNMLVKVVIASGRPDAENVTITATLTSTAADDPGNNIVVANPGATFNFSISYTVAKPVIVFTATQSNVTTNASRIPGADVTYTMSLDNTGTGNVSGASTVTFVLDSKFRYVSSTAGGTLSGSDANGNGGTVTWSVAATDLEPADPALTLIVVVEPEQVTNNGTGVTAGTTVYAMTTAQSTQTKIQYNDGVNTYNQDNANSFNFAVGSASGALLTQVTANSSGTPGATVEYQYTLKNMGNHSDGFDLTQANDATGDLDVAHVFATSSGGASITQVTGVAAGATTTLYIRVVVPTTGTDGQTIKRNLTATTQTSSPTAPTGGSTSSTDNLTTTVSSPSVAVTIAGGQSDIISGGVGGNVVPGTVMRWTVTITNTGSASATNVSSSNVNAHLTTNTVVANSFDIDADGNGTFEITSVGDGYNSGGITITVNGTTGIATVTFSSIPASANRKYRYNVSVQ
jgi:hypothetical protein